LTIWILCAVEVTYCDHESLLAGRSQRIELKNNKLIPWCMRSATGSLLLLFFRAAGKIILPVSPYRSEHKDKTLTNKVLLL
jgi:hypothetical protein